MMGRAAPDSGAAWWHVWVLAIATDSGSERGYDIPPQPPHAHSERWATKTIACAVVAALGLDQW